MCYGVYLCYGVSPCHVTFAWVTRPERPKGMKDKVKRPEGPPARSRGSEDPETSIDRYLNLTPANMKTFLLISFGKLSVGKSFISPSLAVS